HRQRAVALHAPRTRAGRTGIVDDLTAALAGRTGALEREETLGLADLAVAAAGRARLRLGARLGAAAGADLAGDRGRNAHLGGLAVEGFPQGDFHVVAQIRTALATAAARAATAHAEEIVENVGEGRGKIGAEAGAAPHALLERRVAEAIIGGALVAVLEHLVGLVDLLEAVLAVLVTRVAVRVKLHGKLAKGALDVGVAGRALDSENLVVIALGQVSALFATCRTRRSRAPGSPHLS